MIIYFQSIFLNVLGILPSIFSKFTFQKFMLFNQTNQFKKQEFQTVKKKEQTDRQYGYHTGKCYLYGNEK